MIKNSTILLVSILLVMGARESQSCSCETPLPPLDAMNQSDGTFLGAVTSIETIGSDTRVRVRLSKTYKGPASESMIIRASSPSLCDFQFETGKAYLIFASRQEGEWTVSLCSRTQALPQAQADITVLDQAVPTKEWSSEETAEVVPMGFLQSTCLEWDLSLPRKGFIRVQANWLESVLDFVYNDGGSLKFARDPNSPGNEVGHLSALRKRADFKRWAGPLLMTQLDKLESLRISHTPLEPMVDALKADLLATIQQRFGLKARPAPNSC